MNLVYLEIDYHRSDYDAMPAALRGEFIERLAASWLYHECALEGIVVTPQELRRALHNQPCRTHCEAKRDRLIRRLHASFVGLFDEAGTREPMTLDWIKAQHAALCDEGEEGAGRYRKRDTSPGVYNLDVIASQTISYHLRRFLDNFEGELSESHPVRAAALAHWELMKIFPFDERTGLVTRLMTNAILMRHDYPPAVIHASERHTYFGALNGHRADMIPVIVDAVSATISAATAFSSTQIATIGHHAAL